MEPFIYNGLPSRVIFGAGSLDQLDREIDLLGATRAIVLSTPQQRAQAEALAASLGSRAAGVYAEAVMHVPVETAREARDFASQLGADCAIAIGGGSTTGLGKAIALETSLPIIAIPTTYAGSEMTPIYGLTEAGVKKTGRDLRVLPKTVIYDPSLTTSLPPALSLTSGINAIAHAAEGLYAQDTNPIIALMAEEGIRALGQGSASRHASTRRSRCTWRLPLWRVAVRRGARQRRHGAASQAVPYARRHASICRTRRHTRSCCRMRSPITAKPRPMRCSASLAHCTPTMPPKACSISHVITARPPR